MTSWKVGLESVIHFSEGVTSVKLFAPELLTCARLERNQLIGLLLHVGKQDGVLGLDVCSSCTDKVARGVRNGGEGGIGCNCGGGGLCWS